MLISCGSEEAFQSSADSIRLEHLLYWSKLVEEYHAQVGRFPLQDRLTESTQIALVEIATKGQIRYLSPGFSEYDEKLDFGQQFEKHTVRDFVKELETGLGRTVDEKYDIQKIPTSSPIGYYYFVTGHGYVMWVTCISCGVTRISTLLFDGFTPTVNVVSKNMAGEITKALTRDEMISHPIFREWQARLIRKEEYVRNLVHQNIHDSKS
ncbi:MAG: hypothetical protein ACI9BW_002389 [Gammaproteobacteria bacterium]|jgi:hypothetical protein